MMLYVIPEFMGVPLDLAVITLALVVWFYVLYELVVVLERKR